MSMASRGETLDSRVARLEEIVRAFMADTKEYRIESRADSKDIIARLDNLRQDQQSTSGAVHALTLQDCGTRLTEVNGRLDHIETALDLPNYQGRLARWREMDATMKRWESVLGTGRGIIWRAAGAGLAVLATGWIGAHVHF